MPSSPTQERIVSSSSPQRLSRAMSASTAQKMTSLDTASRSTQVVEQLTDLILNGEWKPTELLPPERDLAAQFGVSRNVVREAIKILQSRGLITIRHGVGTMVNGPSSEPLQHVFTRALHGQEDALLQLTEVRLLVEVEMASLAAQRATPENLQKIREVLAKMALSLDEPQRYVDLDKEFHSAVAEATQNSVFALVMEASAALTRQARVYALESGSSIHKSLQIHRGIYEAIEARDAELAATRMRDHLKGLETDIKRGL